MTNDTKAPERIWAWETLNCNGQWTIAEGEGVEYIRHDHALALVAAAYEDAATTASCECQCGPVSLETKILRRTPADAQAALEAYRKRVREDERKRIKMGLGELLAGQSKNLPRDLRQKMLAVIEGDTDE